MSFNLVLIFVVKTGKTKPLINKKWKLTNSLPVPGQKGESQNGDIFELKSFTTYTAWEKNSYSSTI